MKLCLYGFVFCSLTFYSMSLIVHPQPALFMMAGLAQIVEGKCGHATIA